MDKNRIAERKQAWALLTVSLLFQLCSLAVYVLTGVTEFTPALSLRVFGFGGSSLILGLILLIAGKMVGEEHALKKLSDYGLFLVYALGLLAWLFYLTSEINYIANILVAIDGTGVSSFFVLRAGLFLAAWLLALLSAIAAGKRNPIEANSEQEVA